LKKNQVGILQISFDDANPAGRLPVRQKIPPRLHKNRNYSATDQHRLNRLLLLFTINKPLKCWLVAKIHQQSRLSNSRFQPVDKVDEFFISQFISAGLCQSVAE
jgi:hypothetical protein